MPTLNKKERVQAMMRLLHKNTTEHLNKAYNADMLSSELGIPSASVRRTLYIDYPECFIRNRVTGLQLSGNWPDGIRFDPSDDPTNSGRDTVKLFPAKFLTTDFTKYLNQDQILLLATWFKATDSGIVPLSLRKGDPPKEWWDLYNAAQSLIIFLKLLTSRRPEAYFNKAVSHPENAPKSYMATVETLSQYIKEGKSQAS